MKVSRLRALFAEICKTLNFLHRTFLNNFFKLRESDGPVCEKYKLNLTKWNQIYFGRIGMVHLAPAKLAEINPFLHSAYEQARQLVFTSGVCGKHFPEGVLFSVNMISKKIVICLV